MKYTVAMQSEGNRSVIMDISQRGFSLLITTNYIHRRRQYIMSSAVSLASLANLQALNLWHFIMDLIILLSQGKDKDCVVLFPCFIT